VCLGSGLVWQLLAGRRWWGKDDDGGERDWDWGWGYFPALTRTSVTSKQEHILTMADKKNKYWALFFTVPKCDENKQNE